MLKDRETFLHWPHRALGDTPAEHASRALLRRLFTNGGLRAPRARIYRNAAGFRQALSIDVGQPARNASALQRMRSCWLVEQDNRQLFLYASEAAPVVGAIGGTSSLSGLALGNAPKGCLKAVCCAKETLFGQKVRLSLSFPLLRAQYGHAF